MKAVKILSAALLVLTLACSHEDGARALRDLSVVFVGASITEAWNFQTYFPGYSFKKVIYYDYDKAQVWNQIRALDPDMVVVKECGAYFYAGGGTPLAPYENVMKAMANLCRGAGAVPVLATTIPVDPGFGGCTREQLDDIITFNAWVRDYCAANDVALMDYYNRIADWEGHLPRNCHDGDGLHPNDAGYGVLSEVVLPALEGAKP